jgi:hypothetical protein
MMNRFAGAQPTGLGRKAFWIAVAVIVAVLACASAVLSGGGPYIFGEGGMPRPDGMMVQQDPGRPPITYNARARADGSILITRNGVAWITVANTKTDFVLSDPNGTGRPVIKFEHSSGHGGAVPIRLRAPAR